MAVIDEKGRIFGIINIIDLATFIFFVFFITGFLQLLHTGELFKDFDPKKIEYIKKEVDLLIDPQDLKSITYLKKSTENNSMISEGLRIINITSIESVQMICRQNNPHTIKILAELDTHLDRNTQTYYYKDNQLIEGFPLVFELNQKKIIAKILEVK